MNKQKKKEPTIKRQREYEETDEEQNKSTSDTSSTCEPLNVQKPEETQDRMDIYEVRPIQFAVVLSLNECDLTSVQVNNEIFKNVKDKIHTLIIGNLAAIEVNIINEFNGNKGTWQHRN